MHGPLTSARLDRPVLASTRPITGSSAPIPGLCCARLAPRMVRHRPDGSLPGLESRHQLGIESEPDPAAAPDGGSVVRRVGVTHATPPRTFVTGSAVRCCRRSRRGGRVAVSSTCANALGATTPRRIALRTLRIKELSSPLAPTVARPRPNFPADNGGVRDLWLAAARIPF
jgi:hypothetical protein